jgi:chromate transporter
MSDILDLVLRFLVIGAIAFGGGAATLPLVERIAVTDTGWLTQQQFALGLGFAYATPGPVLIMATFIGFHAAGLGGAIAATAAVFAIPVILAAGSANVVTRLNRYASFREFGRFAGAASIGLLMVTLASLAAPLVEFHPALLVGSAAIFVADSYRLSPVLLLVIAGAIGAVVGAVGQ